MEVTTIPKWKTALRSFKIANNPIPFLDEVLTERETGIIYLGGLYKMVVTKDPGFVQHILQKNHKNYQKSEVQFERISHFLGKGLLSSEGNYWLRQRRLIQPGFHKARLEAILGSMTSLIDQNILKLKEEVIANPVVNINHSMMEITFRIIANAIFSRGFEKNELNELSEAITTLQLFIIKQIRQPYLNLIQEWSGQVKKHEAVRDQLNQNVLKYIDERRNSGDTYDDLLQMLLDARYEDTGEGMTDQQLIDETNILFVAGHETSANAMAWTLYLLAKHPKVVTRIREELSTSVKGTHPTFEELMRLQYTECVLNESMRLFPPAWITNRVAIEDDEYNGFKIDKGTVFAAYIYGVHHSNHLWEDPYDFQPERFLKSNKKERHPFAFAPFGGGPRLCIGYQFAMMEMKVMLLKLVEQFDFELVPGQDIEPKPLITLRPKEDIMLRFRSLGV